jgi:Arc/MetJ family transcription regulator
MKRTNLVLDATLLEEARRELGTRTYSAAVNQALAEVIRVRRVRGLAKFFGSGIWKGDLAAMREDEPRPGRAKAAARGRR